MSDDGQKPQPADTDGIATGFALGRASAAVDQEVVAFLHEQRQQMREQFRHLEEQYKNIRLRNWEQRLGVVLRVATAFMGLAVAGTLGLMVWSASQSNGLLIEPFSVPPDLAGRGVTGQVVAARLLDRLTQMQSQTNTSRPAMSYANAWVEHGIKLQIPQTGVSLAELDNYLREKLGHDIHVSGEVVRDAHGLSLTARAGDEGAETVAGPEADLDTLVQQLAESVYRITQPYRYAAFLLRHENRPAEALPIFKRLALTGSPEDRLWSYNMWGVTVSNLEGIDAGLRMYRQAAAADPDAIGAWNNLSLTLFTKSRPEEALQALQAELMHLTNGRQKYISAAGIPLFQERERARLDAEMGAFHNAMPIVAKIARTGLAGYQPEGPLSVLVRVQTGEHDVSAARASMADFPAGAEAANLNMLIDTEAGDWAGVLSQGGAIAAAIREDPLIGLIASTNQVPLLAYAEARLGNFAAAEARIAPTPADCYLCLRTRARIAALRGQHGRADWWFARAEQAAPSFPFAFLEHGQALMARGDLNGAIVRFEMANRKSPHFADPLEMWGEALMAGKHPDAALAKFEDAEKYAPNWGRLHLKWGEALAAAGKPDDAKKQFARAAGLDLSNPDKAELERQGVH